MNARLSSKFFLIPLLLFAVGAWHGEARAANLTLTWVSNSTNEDGFKVERKTGTSGTFAQIATVGTKTTSYIDSGATTGTTYCYRVRAYNTAGDSAYSNEACGAATSDTQAPTVSITAPVNGATVSGSSVTVSASASDNVGVAGVRFLLDGANLGSEDTTAPYSVVWNTTSATNGTHSITAVARDAAGNTTTSTAVTVTVSNQAPPPPDPSGLMAAYSFNEGSGTTVTDDSGNNRTGTLAGATWTTAGQFSNALAFDGVKDYVNLGTFDIDGPGLTLSAWINPNSFQTSGNRIIDKAKGTAEGDHWWMLGTIPSGNTHVPRFRLKAGGTTTTLIASSGALTTGVWTHLAATYDGQQMRLYKDGVEVGSVAKTGTINRDASIPVNIARNPSGASFSYWHGRIDEVRLYQRALTASEIQADMTTPVGTVSSPPSPQSYTLTVTKAGSGSGTVSSSPAGISCGADCSEPYASGTSVTLTATPASGSTFSGWSGDADCADGSVTLTAAKTCTATFALVPQSFTLTVAKAGTGSGTVSSSPAGISCGADCSESYTSGTAVTLTATPASGSTFSGWSGACSGTGSCTITMTANTSVTATFALQTYTLSVAKAGEGSGTVNSSPAGISCGADCSETYDSGTSVTLTATPASGSTFSGWSGACSGSSTCTVTMTATTSVTATFATSAPQSYTLTVAKAGTGNGIVSSSPAGISCGADCSESYTSGTAVTLTATPAAGSTFSGWSGACSGTGTCSVTVTANTSLTASFSGDNLVAAYSFNEGSGTTVTDDSGNNRTGTLAGATWTTAGQFSNALAFDGVKDYVNLGTFDIDGPGLTLSAWINPNSFQTSGNRIIDKAKGTAEGDHWWMLGTIPSGNTHVPRFRLKAGGTTTTLIASSGALTTGVWTHLAATYDGQQMRLYKDGVEVGSVAKTGTINRDASIPVNIARNPSGASFSYWHGRIDEVRLYQRALTASEIQADMTTPVGTVSSPPSPQSYTLTVTKAGSGSGTVSSNPAGISCGADCSEPYTSGTSVTLTATPAAGSTFSGWSGACSGTSSCTVTMTATASVTATFATSAPQSYTLTVAKAGTGSGMVSSSPAGISCGADCSESYTSGTAVILTATPAAGSTFTGWSGACSGTGSCTITMTANTSVTATFALQTYTLSVAKAGEGSGTVNSSPAGISCGADCSETYDSGTSVTLTATPASGSTFSGWSGACSGSSTCTVTLSANTSVTATFAPQMNAKIGIFRPSTGEWFLDLNGNGVLDDCTVDACVKSFGQQGNLPVVGDWTGIGTAQIGIFEPKTRLWKLDRNGNDRWDDCTVDLCLGPFINSVDLPVVGRWKAGASTDMIGIYRPSKRLWRLDFNGNGKMDACTVDGCYGNFGQSTDLPVVGDWTGSGTTKIGVFEPNTGLWKLDKNGNGKSDSCTVDSCMGPFGISGDRPVAGDWTGDGKAKIGVFDPATGMWEFDLNGNGTFDGCEVDACLGPFGQQGDLPVVGKW